MFGNRSRRSLRRGRRIGRRHGFGRGLNIGAIVKIGGIGLAAVGLILVVIFVIVPLFSSAPSTSDTTDTTSPEVSLSPTPSVDLTKLAAELQNTPDNVTDPYLYINGDTSEMIYSTGDNLAGPDTIAVYNIKTQSAASVSGITKKNDGLFEPKENDKYIVYLDCKSKDGGSVCGYDKGTSQQFVMRDYVYGKPKVTISGEYALWLQQTLDTRDKLYLYDLKTRECVTLEYFINVSFFVSAPYISDDKLIYMQPKGESRLLDGSSSLSDVELSIIPLTDKGDKNRILGNTGTFVYDPKMKGNDIVFLDGVEGPDSHLMYCKLKDDAKPTSDTSFNPDTDPANNLTKPVEIATGVLNYSIGDGFAAYTKDSVVYVYFFSDGSTSTLSEATTRALLCSVSGKDVIWYDITDGTSDVPDSIIHIQIP